MTTYFAKQLTAQFYEWEKWGRGWQLWEAPINLEPPYRPFVRSKLPDHYVDDGQSDGVLSWLASWFTASTKPPISEGEEKPNEINARRFVDSDPLWEIKLDFDRHQSIAQEVVEQFLLVACIYGQISFEIVSNGENIAIQIVCRGVQKLWIEQQLQAHFSNVRVTSTKHTLQHTWKPDASTAILDLGLREECMRPLATKGRMSADPLAGVIAALELVQEGELGMVQMLITPTTNPWAAQFLRAVSDGKGGSFFSDDPDMLSLTKEKIAHPLYAVVVRIIAQGSTKKRSAMIANGLTHTVITATRSKGNELIPLSNVGISLGRHLAGVVRRYSFRTGMLLNSQEIITLLHPPSPSIVSTKLRGVNKKTKAAPKEVLGHSCILGANEHGGVIQEVSLSDEQRLRHVHIIGATGTGKTTLLKRSMLKDMEAGRGLMLLDPHGDVSDELLSLVPDKRFKDVVIIDPSDVDFPIGINILSAKSEVEKIILSGDLVAMFKRFANSWGDQMHSVLANAILAFMEHPTGGTLLDLRRFLVEPTFRRNHLQGVTDQSVTYYWEHEFPTLRKNATAPILTRLDTFLRTKLIRNMMAQKKGLNFAKLVNNRKIILVKLAQGLIGRENSYLLGSLLVAKINQIAQSRQTLDKSERTPFFLYIDECHNFFTSSMEEILSGARKFGLGMVLAHQSLSQLKTDLEVGRSIIANAGTRICFRVGDEDAKKLEAGFSFFEAEDLQYLKIGQAIMRVGQSNLDFNLATEMLPEVDKAIAEHKRQALITYSRKLYAKPRAEVEANIYLPRKGKTVTASSPPQATPKEPSPIPIKEQATTNTDPIELPVQPTSITSSAETPHHAIRPKETTATNKKTEQKRQHLYFQSLFKHMAEGRGFKAVLEEPTPDGKGRVDVGLIRNGKRYAIEISITTTPQHEVGNIQKCLNAGYEQVIATSPQAKHLQKINTLAKESLSKIQLAKVNFLEPDNVIAFLNEIAASEENTDQVVKGYRVKVNYQSTSPDEQLQKQESISKVIGDSMKRMKE